MGKEEPKGTPQGDLLRRAVTLVEGDRNRDYGRPSDDFTKTAGILNALGYRGPGGRLLSARDWPVMSWAAKLSRLEHTPDHYDSVADMAGYAGCYWDCIVAEQEKN